MKIAIIGKGNVGSSLEAGHTRAGHEIRAVGREAGAVREAGEAAEIVILAVPFGQIDNAVQELGSSVVELFNVAITDLKPAIRRWRRPRVAAPGGGLAG